MRKARSTEEAWEYLATRIPKELHRELKLHCVDVEMQVMDLVVQAIKEKHAREGRRSRSRAG